MNKLFNCDFYKITHPRQLPERTSKVYSYIESRGGQFDFSLFFGLQGFLKEYLCGQFVTQKDIDEAEVFYKKGFGFDYFDKKGWEHILNKYNGHLPLKISAIPEGTCVPVKNVLVTIENTDEKVPWLTQFIETMLLRAIWFPTTVATASKTFKNIIKKYCDITGTEVSPFHLNDFSSRGCSSHETAGIGGSAHLCNFLGSDNVEGVRYAMKNYNTDVCGFSVLAGEHHTVTIYGKKNELKAYDHLLDSAPDEAIVSIVIDSYDMENAVKNLLGGKLKEKILARKGKVVFRPDSGDITKVPVQIVKWLWDIFGGTINERGYKVLNPKVSVIQGDSVSIENVPIILDSFIREKFCISNIILGAGGKLLQAWNRDSMMWAQKACWGIVDGKEIDIFKDPITDQGKKSKKGRLKLIKTDSGYETVNISDPREDQLRVVFKNGVLYNETTFDEVRKRAAL